MQEFDDTIVAISTPPGRGGIGIVRISGPEARAFAETLLRLKLPLLPGRARFAELLDPATGHVLDQTIATFFAAPNSYTTEDVVEIAAHGSPVLLEFLLREIMRQGARLAEPGEFTQRAFLAGRIDLTQAEAVHDLIASTTMRQAQTAAQQLGGALSNQLKPVKQSLMMLIAALEAGIDFAEDDLDVMPQDEIFLQIREIEAPLQKMEQSFAYGRVLREGFRLALVGRPNAGKSSLFNRLIGRDRAIVTASPGTTRDPVAERLEVAGVPVELIDTAGLRSTADEAEFYGVEKSRETMAAADVVLLVVAANEPLHTEDIAVLIGASERRTIVAVNKIDLVRSAGRNGVGADDDVSAAETAIRAQLEGTIPEDVIVATSALDGTGLDELRGVISSMLGTGSVAADTILITNLRQYAAISAALEAIQSAGRGVVADMPHEMLLLDLKEALDALDLLTGATHSEDLLSLIFSKFCIGK